MRKAYKTVACLLAGTVLLTGAGLPNKVQAAGIETNEFAYLAGSPVENSLESKISASQEITQEKADTVKAINTVEDTIGTSLDNAAVSNVENYTEIKAAADDNSEVVGKLYNQSLVIITENPNNGWYKIHSGSVDGYVKAETLTVGNVNAIQATSYQTADVMTDSLKVRSEMSTESGVVTMVDTGSKLSVLGEADGWVAVSTAAGNGYVSAEYVQVTTQYKQAISRAEEEEAARQAEEAARKAEEEKKTKISNVQVGLVTEGVVESLQPYGAFVDLGNGLSGLVHISQICEKRIKKPSEVLTVGDKVKVKVTAVKDGKLSLSIKEATDMMAKEIEEEVIELPDSKEEASTSLASLFANIKLN